MVVVPMSDDAGDGADPLAVELRELIMRHEKDYSLWEMEMALQKFSQSLREQGSTSRSDERSA